LDAGIDLQGRQLEHANRSGGRSRLEYLEAIGLHGSATDDLEEAVKRFYRSDYEAFGYL